MLNPVSAIYDKKTGVFSPPFTVRHVGDAIRDWDIIRKDNNTKYGKNPEDFDLFHIGNYDDTLGQLTTLSPHTHLASGV